MFVDLPSCVDVLVWMKGCAGRELAVAESEINVNPLVVKFPQRLSEISEVPLQLQSIIVHIRQAWTLLESYEHGKVLAVSFD
jgi:hypothetical protein